MVVKTVGHKDGQKGWVYFDKVESLFVSDVEISDVCGEHTSDIPGEHVYLLPRGEAETLAPDKPIALGKGGRSVNRIGFVSCGQEKVIYTQYPVYLLNDNGGTIERI